MGPRFLVCLAAGVVTAGVSGAMIAGAGVAAADTASDSSGASSSESAQSNGSKADSPRRGFGAKQRRAARPDSSSSSGAAASESAEPGEIKGNSGTRRFVKRQRPASRPESAPTDPGTSTTEDKTGQADPKEADDHDTTGEVAPADKQARAVDRIATARSDIRARVAAAIGGVDAAGPQTPAAPAKAKLEPAAVARDIGVDGFPQPESPPAVQALAISWINDWFEGRTDVGDDDLVPGSTIDITTPKGTARAIVIGEAPATSLAGYWPDLVA